MYCPICATQNSGMFGVSAMKSMNLIYLENGNIAKFMLVPIAHNGTNKLMPNYPVLNNGQIKLEAYVCYNCSNIQFKGSS